MKISIRRADLAQALRAVKGAAGGDAASVLGSIRLVTGPDSVTLTATDRDLVAVATCAAEVGETGCALIAGKALVDIVAAVPPGAVMSIESGGTKTTIRAGSARWALRGLDVEEFSATDKDEDEALVRSAGVVGLLRSVAFAASSDESRAMLCGALLELDAETQTLRATATDGHRLSTAEASGVECLGSSWAGVVHRRGLSEVLRVFADGEPVTVSATGRQVAFAATGRRLLVREAEGQFPDYRRVVPALGEVASVDAAELAAAVARVGVMACNRATTPMRVELADGLLRLSVTSVEVGDGYEEVAAKWDGDAVEAAVNPRYVLDALAATQPDEEGNITLQIGRDPFTPCVLRGAGSIHVIMPMRL